MDHGVSAVLLNQLVGDMVNVDVFDFFISQVGS